MTRSMLAAAMIALLVPAGAGAGTILGTVQGSAGYGRGVADVVVWLDGIPDKLERKLAKHAPTEATVVQGRHGFSPPVLVVAPGTTVRFVNRDRRFHNVFSVAPKFDLGRYGPGHSVTITLEHPGALQLFCELHPAESGWVRVTPGHAFVQTDRNGAFRFPKLPKGSYALRFWHPRFGTGTRLVELQHGDAVVSLRF